MITIDRNATAANGRREKMTCKPLAIVSLLVLLIAMAGLEGGGLSAGQALALALPAGVLAVWSFRQTDWWD